MKKRYLAIAGLLVLAVAAAGCGKEKDKPAEQQVQATPTVTPQVTEAADLVDMEVSDEKNVIGEKTATASKVAIVNRTGSEIGVPSVVGQCVKKCPLAVRMKLERTQNFVWK